MDETLDPDVSARALALKAAMWFYDKTGRVPQDEGAVEFTAECFLHYLGNGELNAFDCKDELRKTVRGA